MKRHTYTAAPDIEVHCRDCDWEYAGKNGVGLAAQHCDRYEHIVSFDSYGGGTFVPPSRKKEYDAGRLKGRG